MKIECTNWLPSNVSRIHCIFVRSNSFEYTSLWVNLCVCMCNTELTYKITPKFLWRELFCLGKSNFFESLKLSQWVWMKIMCKPGWNLGFNRILRFDKYRGAVTLHFCYMPNNFHHCRASQYFCPLIQANSSILVKTHHGEKDI